MKIYQLIQIETPRLIIRPIQLGDEFSLNRAVNHSLHLLQKWQPWAKDPSMAATQGFVQRGVFAWASCSINDFPMVIIHKHDQKIIGASGYNNRSKTHEGLYEIGYWCDVDYHGQGYVTECANALTRYAFDALQGVKVVISMQIENKKSLAVAERLGFQQDGISDRDPLDCVSDQPEKNYDYSTNNIDHLPALEIAWMHADNHHPDSCVIRWAKEALNITDNTSFSNSKIIIKSPWSTVMSIDANGELFYLKQTPELIANEAKIIQILHDQFNASVPVVIAHAPELNSFLMKEAGTTLRCMLKKRFDTELLCKAIDQFTALQIAVADHVEVFFNVEVPDWRLAKLPSLFQEAVSQKDILMTDGLSEREINVLEALLPKIIYLSQKLADYSFKQTIVQPDFNDNNTLIDEKSQTITMIDLGEIAISHPFFSLLNCLHVVKKHHALTNEDDRYITIKKACLKNYLNIESEKNVLKAFEIAHVLWPVYGLLAHDRLIQACGKEKMQKFQPVKRTEMLRKLIASCSAYEG